MERLMPAGNPCSQRHGGNLNQAAHRLACRPGQLLDASASLVPFGPPGLLLGLGLGLGLLNQQVRAYPDRTHATLRAAMARIHGLDPAWVLPGNGAAELFTWVARDAAACGVSAVPAPGFADYGRALACWGGAGVPWPLPLHWDGAFPQPLSPPPTATVLWITNPHNPTGQLWSRASIEPLLADHRLVIVDEAFLPLVPGGEAQSLIPLVEHHPNLVVLRSLTKLYGMAGLRLGYAVGEPQRLQRWASWRDPWPVNGIAAAVGERLLRNPGRYRRHCERVQRWTAREGAWLSQRIAALQGPVGRLTPLPSAANYLLLHAETSLGPLREAMEGRHLILLRDCQSFEGLGANWLRIGYQSRRGNRRLMGALQQVWASQRG